MLQRILDEGYIKVDYEIDFPYEEFTNEVFRNTEYWKLEMVEWTPFETDKCNKWCTDMYNLNKEILNDPLYEDTKNCKASILKYNKNHYLEDHTDRGMLTFIYNLYPGLHIKVTDNMWQQLDYGLFVWLGDIGAKQFNRPAINHRVHCKEIRWSLNYFSVPGNIDNPWTPNEMTGPL